MAMRRNLLNVILIAGLSLAGSASHAVAQSELPELETDRDAFTPATSTAGERLTIFESAYSFIDNRKVAETHSFPELLIRHGVTENIEFRLGWNYEVGGNSRLASGNEGSLGPQTLMESGIERESEVSYGLKAALTEQDHWLPRSAVILQGFTPTRGEATETDLVAAYVFGWELPNKWRLDSAMRYATEHDRDDVFNEWAPSVVLRVPVTEEWNIHAEYFGIYSQGAEREFSEAFLSPGTHFLITPNLELGVRVGWGLTEDAPNFFSNVGFGWRF
jgi:hypothetical protein